MPEQCCILINEIDWYLAISYLEVARKFIDIDFKLVKFKYKADAVIPGV